MLEILDRSILVNKKFHPGSKPDRRNLDGGMSGFSTQQQYTPYLTGCDLRWHSLSLENRSQIAVYEVTEL
jgi:hypothetical protein